MKKRSVALLLFAAMLISLLTVGAAAENDNPLSGKCGQNALWSFDRNTGTLTISGTGAMSEDETMTYNCWEADIKSIIIEDGITEICNYAFFNFNSLKNVQIADTVKSIGCYAFFSESLRYIKIPKGVEQFGTCDNLTGYIFDYYISPIYRYSTYTIDVDDQNSCFFTDDGVLYQVNSDGTFTLLIYPANKTDSTYYVLSGTKSIASYAFASNDYITKVVMPDSMRIICDSVFNSCSKLSEVVLNDGIKSIASSSFWSCESLSRLDLPASVVDFMTNFSMHKAADETPKVNLPELSIYFHGNKAPNFNAMVAETHLLINANDTKVTFYYPKNASGWDELLSDYRNYSGIYGYDAFKDVVVFKTWDASQDTAGQDGIDPFSFINSNRYFEASNYSVTGRYLQALKDTISAADWVDVQNLMSRSWSGACYGMSAVFILNYAGDLEPAYFQSGADRLYDLNYPKDSTTVKNLIHYYYLQQKTDYGSNSFYEYKVTNHYYNEELVHIMESGDYPVMISFFVGSSGHAVVGLDGARNSDGSYSVTIYDPNQWETDTLTVSADYSKISFASGKYSGSRGIFNNKAFSTRSATFDHANIQDYLAGGLSAVSGSTYKLSTNLSDFTVSNGNGDSATVKNGRVSGNLDIKLSLDYESGDISYILPSSSSYTITPNGSGYISLTIGSYNVQLNSSDISSLTLTSSGKVTTTAPKAVQQEIVLTSDKIGSTWNSVTVSGKDSGFELSASNGKAEVSSDNNVSVSVTGSNIFTGESDAAKKVDASKDGTTVSLDGKGDEISITSSGNGKISVEPASALAGEKVTITLAPDPGYSIGSITVTGPEGKISISAVNSTTYSFTMPDGKVSVAVVFVLKSLPFLDVPTTAWYYDAVSYVYANGMMTGVSDTAFGPDTTMTRAMFWTVLARIDGGNVDGGSPWYAKAQSWAMSSGVSDGSDPDGIVTREMFVTMLWRYAGSPAASGSLTGFPDAAKVSSWASEAMRWAVANGVIAGVDGSLSPDTGITRAQAATIFMRYAQL